MALLHVDTVDTSHWSLQIKVFPTDMRLSPVNAPPHVTASFFNFFFKVPDSSAYIMLSVQYINTDPLSHPADPLHMLPLSPT